MHLHKAREVAKRFIVTQLLHTVSSSINTNLIRVQRLVNSMPKNI